MAEAIVKSPSNPVHRKKRFFKHDEKSAYLLLSLPLIWWCVFFLYAFVRALLLSFTDATAIVSYNFIGFENYVRLFQDNVFWLSLRNTFIWTLVTTVANNGIGLFVAWLVSKMRKGQKLFLTLLFWPTLVSAVISSSITMLLFDPSDTGFLNVIIQQCGGTPLGWYNDPKLSLLTLMIIPTLLGFSTQMMIYYVAIMGVSRDYVEAALIDGASSHQIFWNIYFPEIRNALQYNLLLSIIAGIKVIGPMQLITDGGPLNSSMSILLYLYDNMFKYNDMSYACTIGVVALIIIMALSFIQMRMTAEKKGTGQ